MTLFVFLQRRGGFARATNCVGPPLTNAVDLDRTFVTLAAIARKFVRHCTVRRRGIVRRVARRD